MQVLSTEKGAGPGGETEEPRVTMVWGDDSSQEDKREWESIPVDDRSNEASRCVHVAAVVHALLAVCASVCKQCSHGFRYFVRMYSSSGKHMAMVSM